MQYRKLGRSDLNVSVLSVGMWAVADERIWGSQDEKDAIHAVHTALDLGVNLFDSAEGYGNGYSEQILGKALKGRREEAIIATKVGSNNLAHDDVIAACERSLKYLDTDYIDLYQIHWPGRDVPFDETMSALVKLREQGKIRVIGVSNFGKQDIPDMLEIERFESNQVPYNLLWRAIEYDIVPQCVENDIAILTYSPILQGLLAGKFATAADVPDERARTRHFSSEREMAHHGQPGAETETFAAIDAIRQISAELNQPMAQVSLAWLMHQPGVTSVIAGARNADQVRSNVQAADLQLDQATLDKLDQATVGLKEHFGTNPDMWRVPSRYR